MRQERRACGGPSNGHKCLNGRFFIKAGFFRNTKRRGAQNAAGYSYNVLKEDPREYAILLRRDQNGAAWKEIAREFGLSPTRVAQIYRKMKLRQIRLYIRHVSIVQGCGLVQVPKVYNKALEWYQSLACTCAYLEKKYPNILARYRQGDRHAAGVCRKHAALPAQAGQRRGRKHRSAARGKEGPVYGPCPGAALTPEKAKHAYDGYYHARVLKIVKELEALAESEEQKRALRDAVFQSAGTPKKRYDLLMVWGRPAMETPELFEKNGFFPAVTKK